MYSGGGAPPQKSKFSGTLPEQKIVKTRVPQCPQCTKLNQNGALDQGNNLGGSPGPQEVLKYEFLEVIFCTFWGHIPLTIMGSTPPHEEET